MQINNTQRAVSFFVGHGSPMSALDDNDFTKILKDLGTSIVKPKAILIISAHWTPNYNAVSIHNPDELMYDMYGFPQELYDLKYPVPNTSELVEKVQNIIPSLAVEHRNLDHGVWSPLLHIFPKADIPVLQFSINANFSLREHFEIGKQLRCLRDEGIMIIGSGNITHNLSQCNYARDAQVEKWAYEFDDFIKKAIEQRDFDALINVYEKQRYTSLAHPSIEHYLPLLYVAGSSFEDDQSQFLYEKIEYGSLAMRNWLLY